MWFSVFIDGLNEREWPESKEEDFRRKIEMESREKPIEYTKSDHCVGKLLLDIIDLCERAVEERSNLFEFLCTIIGE